MGKIIFREKNESTASYAFQAGIVPNKGVIKNRQCLLKANVDYILSFFPNEKSKICDLLAHTVSSKMLTEYPCVRGQTNCNYCIYWR